MAVAHRESTVNAVGNTTTSFTVVIGSTIVAGDVLFLAVTNRNGAGTDPTVTDDDTGGNTWTRAGGDANDIGTIWWKVATSGTASKTVTVSGCINSSTGGVSAYSGVDTTTPFTDFTTTENAAGTESVAGFTPDNADSFIVMAIHCYGDNVTITNEACTDPGTLTERFEGRSTGGDDCTCNLSSLVQTGGPTATGNFTWTQNNFVTITNCFAIKPAPVGITIDAASNSGEQLADDSYTWNHTCTGSNRYLTVGVGMLSLAQTVSSITYNSVAMTFLGAQSSVSGAARVELWGLIAPATGSNAIVVTLTGAINSGSVAASYTGVHQTSPTEAFNSAQATNVGAADATVAITTVADNDWVVDIVASDDTAITVGAGQTQRNNIAGTVGAVADSDEGPKTPAGSVTMSWANVGALATWSIAGIALRPIAAASLTKGTGYTSPFGWF